VPALVLLAALGCRGFEPARPEEISDLLGRLPDGTAPFVRLKVRLKIDSSSLAGVFLGAVVVRRGPEPAVRAQFFPDLGGKVIDLLATPRRITGYFPHQNEGIDQELPGDARIHPLSLVGITILEHAVPVTPARITGTREESDGRWFRLTAATPGVDLAIHSDAGRTVRRFIWTWGIRWREIASDREASVEAPGLSFRIEVLERTQPDHLPESVFQLSLPPEVHRG
jgi:hypothetical protein